jgi:hypothetical protein
MGMFDYIHCEYPLPSCPQALIDRWGKSVRDIAFQTKDTPDQVMTAYTITADGYLLVNRTQYEWIDTPEKVDKSAGELQAWFNRGYNKVVREWTEQCLGFNGAIEFYESYAHADKKPGDDYQRDSYADGWVEYKSLFQNGQLLQISQSKHTRPVKYTQLETADRQLARAMAIRENHAKQHKSRHENPNPEQRLIDTIKTLLPQDKCEALQQIDNLINEYRTKHDRWYAQS